MACKVFQEMVTLGRMGRSKEMGLVLVLGVGSSGPDNFADREHIGTSPKLGLSWWIRVLQ